VKKNIKLWSIFFISIFLIMLYCVLIPKKDAVFYKYYTYEICFIIYIIIIIFAIKNTELEKFNRKKWISAIVLGILGSMAAPNWLGVLSGICTFFSYLYCISKNDIFEINTQLIREKNKEYILDDFKIICIGFVIYFIILWITTLLSENGKIGLKNFGSSVGAGVSEEIIFRWFILTFMRQMNKGQEIGSILYYSMVLVPFSVLHVVDMLVLQGINYNIIFNIINLSIFVLPLAVLVKKRDVFTAIVLHFVFDFIRIV